MQTHREALYWVRESLTSNSQCSSQICLLVLPEQMARFHVVDSHQNWVRSCSNQPQVVLDRQDGQALPWSYLDTSHLCMHSAIDLDAVTVEMEGWVLTWITAKQAAQIKLVGPWFKVALSRIWMNESIWSKEISNFPWALSVRFSFIRSHRASKQSRKESRLSTRDIAFNPRRSKSSLFWHRILAQLSVANVDADIESCCIIQQVSSWSGQIIVTRYKKESRWVGCGQGGGACGTVKRLRPFDTVDNRTYASSTLNHTLGLGVGQIRRQHVCCHKAKAPGSRDQG